MNATSSSPAEHLIPNVLAERYASAAMKEIWSQYGRVTLERDFWIAVMKAQRDLGVPIPAEAIRDYEKVKGQVDLTAIAQRERVTLHDVKARIEEFSDLAKRQFIHLGLTSRDLTENVEQLQVLRALKLVQFKVAATLLALAKQADAHRDLMITGRTHNVPAQPTTLGKRLAMFGQEMLLALQRLDDLLKRYPVSLVTPMFLLRNFKYVILVAFVLAAVITPTSDIPNMMIMAVPMILLYLLGIIVAFLFGKKRQKEPEDS